MTDSIEYFSEAEIAWRFIPVKENVDDDGILGVSEFLNGFDFSVKRFFYLRNVKSNARRGFHAHESLKQILYCLQGSMDISLDTGSVQKTITLHQGGPALFLNGKVWREMENFEEGTVVLVLCDREYRFDNVIRNRDEFLSLVGAV